MMTKFGLILLVLLFGAALFVLGLLAPDSVRRPVIEATQNLSAKHAASAAQKPTAAALADASEKQTEPVAIAYQDLLLPSPLPLDGAFALELGRFAASASADALVKRAQKSGAAASTINVLDDSGARWTVVVAGRYNTPDEARAARISVSRTLALTQGLPVIRLPPAPAAASPASP